MPMISPFSPKKFTFLKVTSFLSWEDETLSLSPQRVGRKTSYFPSNPGCLINRDPYISWFYEIIPHKPVRMSFPPFSTRKTTNRLGPFSFIAHPGRGNLHFPPHRKARFRWGWWWFLTRQLWPPVKSFGLTKTPTVRNFQPPPGDETVGNWSW